MRGNKKYDLNDISSRFRSFRKEIKPEFRRISDLDPRGFRETSPYREERDCMRARAT
jgi:hypothetical protein